MPDWTGGRFITHELISYKCPDGCHASSPQFTAGLHVIIDSILYDAEDHGIFLISENDGFPSDTRQRDHFKHQNVRIRSNENKIKKNSDKLLTC